MAKGLAWRVARELMRPARKAGCRVWIARKRVHAAGRARGRRGRGAERCCVPARAARRAPVLGRRRPSRGVEARGAVPARRRFAGLPRRVPAVRSGWARHAGRGAGRRVRSVGAGLAGGRGVHGNVETPGRALLAVWLARLVLVFSGGARLAETLLPISLVPSAGAQVARGGGGGGGGVARRRVFAEPPWPADLARSARDVSEFARAARLAGRAAGDRRRLADRARVALCLRRLVGKAVAIALAARGGARGVLELAFGAYDARGLLGCVLVPAGIARRAIYGPAGLGRAPLGAGFARALPRGVDVLAGGAIFAGERDGLARFV